MRRQIELAAMALALTIPNGIAAHAQQQGNGAGRRGQFAAGQRMATGQRITGTITGIAGSQITIKTVDGQVYQIATTDNTRVMHGRGEAIKLTDLKVGDGVSAMGNLDEPSKTMHAGMVLSIDAEQMKRMEDAHKEELASLGKTEITGRVTAVDLDNAALTVERPDGVSQTIGFDENTSFRRGRLAVGGRGAGFSADTASDQTTESSTSESITLADIKVGDRVAGPGEVKNGKFVSKELTVMTPGAGRRRPGDAASGSGNGTATAAQSSPQSPK